MNSKLVFVYNAESGLANALVDYGKKLVQPDDYDCQLCMVTYGPFGMRQDWKHFVNALDYPVEFLHKDELAVQHPTVTIDPPGLLLIAEESPAQLLLDHSDFEEIENLADLKKHVNIALAALKRL